LKVFKKPTPTKDNILSPVLVKDHHGQGYPQPDRAFCRADKNTGIAVPAFLRIGHVGRLALDRSEIDIALASVGTLATSYTKFFIDDRWHIILLIERFRISFSILPLIT
jgi:hypothetical protein